VQKPTEMTWFEMTMTGMVLLWAVSAWLEWRPKSVEALGSNAAIIVQVSGIALWLLLVFFTARRRSNLAKWIIVAPFALGLLASPFYIETFEGISLLGWLQTALWAVGCMLLFTPASRRWFKKDSAPVAT
jgi:hypothetical protein